MKKNKKMFEKYKLNEISSKINFGFKENQNEIYELKVDQIILEE